MTTVERRDAVTGPGAGDAARRVIHTLIETSREQAPAAVAAGIRTAACHLGATVADVYLNDYEQRVLRPIEDGGQALGIDSTLAGRAFTTDTRVDATADGKFSAWFPLLDGAARLGVMHIATREQQDWVVFDEFAGLVAELLVCQNQYTDLFMRVRRRQDMSLAAEMCWQLLRPLTFTMSQLAVSAMLEPAYDVGGDVFDYACNEGTLHAAVFDAMGHGVSAAQTSSLALAAYRHARRQGADLPACYAAVDACLREHRPETFATGVLVELECATGLLTWVNAGHPSPMLIRQRAVRRLTCVPALPMGVSAAFGVDAPETIAETQLQVGDRVLVFSDGCTEAATPNGEPFGEDRLGDFLVREQSAGLGVAETLRRLSHAVTDHAGGELQDDATVVLLEYRGQQ